MDFFLSSQGLIGTILLLQMRRNGGSFAGLRNSPKAFLLSTFIHLLRDLFYLAPDSSGHFSGTQTENLTADINTKMPFEVHITCAVLSSTLTLILGSWISFLVDLVLISLVSVLLNATSSSNTSLVFSPLFGALILRVVGQLAVIFALLAAEVVFNFIPIFEIIKIPAEVFLSFTTTFVALSVFVYPA